MFLAACEAALTGAEHGPGALDLYLQTKGPDPIPMVGDAVPGGSLGVRQVIYDHAPQSSDAGELEQKWEGCECLGVPPPGAVLSSHPSQEMGVMVREESQKLL